MEKRRVEKKDEIAEEPKLMHSFSGDEKNTFFNYENDNYFYYCHSFWYRHRVFLISSSGKNGTGSATIASTDSVNRSQLQSGQTYGVADTKSFPDTAEGTLQNGGINGEGQYHLVRPGGDSQSVYMTSSTVDLSLFINRKVKVWGATQKAESAGWLMDVGKVKSNNDYT